MTHHHRRFLVLATIAALTSSFAGRAFAQQVGYVNFVTAGKVDPNNILPAINGVPNAGVANLDIAVPKSVLLQGQAYTYLVSSQVNTFSGNCLDSFQLTQVQAGKTVVLDSGTIGGGKYACGPGEVYELGINGKPIPNSPGPALLIGSVKFGNKKVSIKVPVLIQ